MALPVPNLDDRLLRDLLDEVKRRVPRQAPEWTDREVSDPGITLLELLAYVLTELQYRNKKIDAQGRALAAQVARLAQSLAGQDGAGDCPPGPQRVNYFAGGVLGVDDCTAEQDYFRHKINRRNRALHGAGVVSGLEVTLERVGGTTRVVIAPGLAFNALGEEIEVGAPLPLPLPARGKPLLTLLHYAEQPCRPVPAPATDPQADAQDPMRFSRIAETFTATLAPSADAAAVALARLSFSRGRWALDRKFTAARVR